METPQALSVIADLKAGLSRIGLESGANVLVHSDISSLRECNGTTWSQTAEIILRALMEAVGTSGTLIFPTFNWDFCKGIEYSHENTRSHVGLLSNFVLSKPDSVRSFHPIYSFAGLGPLANSLLEQVSRSSFGSGSVFERCLQKNVTILFLDVLFNECTFVHSVEQFANVNYRFLKYFSGMTSRQGLRVPTTVDFFARKSMATKRDFDRLEYSLLADRELRKECLWNFFSISAVESQAIWERALQGLSQDPGFLTNAGKQS